MTKESGPVTDAAVPVGGPAVATPQTGPVTVVFVAGWGRSGSTILAELVAHTPDAVHVGELRFLWRRGIRLNQLCGCGEHFLDCPFWHEVGEHVGGWSAGLADRMIDYEGRFQRNVRIPAILARRSEGRDADYDYYRRTLDALYRGIRQASGARVVVDSSKDAPYRAILSTLPSVDLRTVHLVRDSRAAAFSWASPKSRPEIADHGELMPAVAAVQASREYDVAHLIHEYISHHTGRTERVRYEDFAVAPRRTVTRLRSAFGKDGAGRATGALVASPADDEMFRSRISHTVSGNPIRFDRGPIVVRLDSRWQRELPAPDRRAITALTLPLLLRYGYVPRRPRRAIPPDDAATGGGPGVARGTDDRVDEAGTVA